MAATFLHDGDSIDYTPGSAVSAGDVVVLNDLIGIAKLDIAANVKGSLSLVGNYLFDKVTGGGTALAVGDNVYYDESEDEATSDDDGGDNVYLGKCVKAAGDSATTVEVRLGNAPSPSSGT
jgi:predicted RecA/RadA family phage recombinase